MTENTPQTSASERIAQARKALAAFDGRTAALGSSVETTMERSMADALRALITPPGHPLTEEGEAVNDALNRYDWPFHERIDISATELADFGTHLFRAGVQAAHETWEPADVPSQEFMLRHLGIRYVDTLNLDGDPIYAIRAQPLDKEVI